MLFYPLPNFAPAQKKSQVRACRNPAQIVHFRAGKLIALHEEHWGRRKSEVDVINQHIH
jgi:hypothetical protein